MTEPYHMAVGNKKRGQVRAGGWVNTAYSVYTRYNCNRSARPAERLQHDVAAGDADEL